MSKIFYLGKTNADLADGDDFDKYLEEDTETAGDISITLSRGSSGTSYGYTRADALDGVDWKTGSIKVKVSIPTGNSGISLKVSASRLDSEGSVEDTTSETNEQTMSSGDYTFTIPSKDWGSTNDTDRLRINYIFRHSGPGPGDRSLEFEFGTDDTEVNTPFTVAGQDLVRVAIESLGLTEARNYFHNKYRAIVDTLSTTESTLKTKVITRIRSETLGITEALAQARARIKTAADNLSMTELVNKVKDIYRVGVENLGLSEGILFSKGLSQVISDTIALTESVLKKVETTIVQIISETLGISEVLARTRDQLRHINESLGMSELITKAKVAIKTITETLDLPETIVRKMEGDIYRVIGEAANFSEAISKAAVRIRVITDSQHWTENISRMKQLLRNIVDSLSVTETLSNLRVLLRLKTETLSFTEQISRLRSIFMVLTDRVDIAELINRIIITPVVIIHVINETLNLEDTWRRFRYNARNFYNKTYAHYGGMAVYILYRERVRIVEELNNLHELIVRARQRIKHISDSLDLTEIVDFGYVLVRIALPDTLGWSDARNYFRDRFPVINELLDIAEDIPLRVRALPTILAVAVTKAYLDTRAYTEFLFKAVARTRTTVRCRLGRDVNMILDIDRGRDKTYEVSVTDEAGRILDLTGATVSFMVKNSVRDADINAVITKTSDNPAEISITNPVGGICEVIIVPDDTDSLPVKRYVYEIKVLTADNKKYTLSLGKFLIQHVVKQS